MVTAYEPLNSQHIANPYPLFVHFRACEPVFFSEKNGYWVVSRYGDVVRLFADPFPAVVMRTAIGALSSEEQKPLADFGMTVNVLALGLRSLLAGRRRHWIDIVDDPATIPSVIEELLRYEGPMVSLFRHATEDAEIGGHPVPVGAKVQLLGAANRDEAVYHCPESFDPSRQMPTVHLSLGAGAHFCVGAPLARMQTRVALEQLSSRLPGLRLAPGQSVTFRPDLRTRVPDRLIVEW